MKNLILFFSIFLLFSGCALKDLQKQEIADLTNIPQNIEYYTKDIKIKDISGLHNYFEKKYFRIWNEDITDDVSSIMWAFKSFTATNSFGENLKPHNDDFFKSLRDNSNFDSFKSVNRKAMTIRYTNLRAMPSIRPVLKAPSLAGEGFPFDYLQNSSIHANEPIIVSHYSKDKEWVFVFSSYASGWIKSYEAAFLDDTQASELQNSQKVFIVKENIPIYDEEGVFLFKSKIGMLFALLAEDENSYTIRVVSSAQNNKAIMLKSKISKETAFLGSQNIDANKLDIVVNELYKNNYGWGGIYEQRDCSSMIRDMFTPFGIWLPRNSYQQSRVGKVIDLKGLSNEEKIQTIKQNAIPFETLLYRKGHIVLYVGTYNDEIIVFHNTWGVRTKENGKDGRFIIGKALFSTLHLGDELKTYDKNSELLKNLLSMNIITS